MTEAVGWAQIRALRRAAEPVLQSSRSGDYLFATFDALEPDEFAEWEWCDLDGEVCYGVLYSEESDDNVRVADGRG